MSDYEAAFWLKDDLDALCELCPSGCRIAPGQSGRCRARRNENGRLCAVNFGCVSALALDPIEKKPLYHFKPGSRVLSAGSWGCNMHCLFCQNWQLSQGVPPTEFYTPKNLYDIARDTVKDGNIGLAYTYSEPLVWYEFVRAAARLLYEGGLDNILVTNGYINPRPLAELIPFIAAANVDLKAFDPDFYRDMCGADISPVKETIKLLAGRCHVEVSALIVPGHNDGARDMERLSVWLAGVDDNIPLHINRYFPRYRLTLPPTPEDTLLELKTVAQRALCYVYVGNI